MNKALGILFVISLPILFLVYLSEREPGGSVFEDVLGLERGRPLVHIGSVPMHVDVADTPETRAKGLSRRSSLPATEGMLFIFDEADYHGIWMKDMLISIDVIWIDERFRVVDITRGLRPSSFPKVFEPRVPARFAIETNANYVESFNISVGDEVLIPKYLIPDDLHDS